MAYRRPLYYEIAFPIDSKKQVNLFEKFIEKYSKRKVKRFLDICCGPSFQLREIAKRGYEAVGLDSSPQMLEYLRKRAKEERIRIETTKGDMVNFRLKKKADFACIMMGTINYLKSNREILSHLDSVAHSLNRGGLYLIENFGSLDWSNEEFFTPLSWTEKRNGIVVKSTHTIELKDSFSYNISVNTFYVLQNKKIQYFDRHGKLRMGTYLFTLDWTEGDFNELRFGFSEAPGQHKAGHIISLDDGNYAIQPNNRIKVFDPSFCTKKEWVIERLLNEQIYSVEKSPKFITEDSKKYHYDLVSSEYTGE